jgi:hypothetical protein
MDVTPAAQRTKQQHSTSGHAWGTETGAVEIPCALRLRLSCTSCVLGPMLPCS